MHTHVEHPRHRHTTGRSRHRRGWSFGAVTALAASLLTAAAPTAGAADTGVLSVHKSVSASTARPGDRLTWTIEVTCESIVAMCQDVTVDDAVPTPFVVDPDGVSVQGQQTGRATVTVSGADVHVALAETDPAYPAAVGLAAGQSVSVLVTTTLPAGTGPSWDGRTVTNTADVAASNARPASADAAVAITVPVTPAVAVTKAFSPTDQVAGQTGDVTAHLSAANSSPVAATALTITDPAASTGSPFGPGTALELAGFGAWALPAGATSMSVELTTGTGSTTIGPFAAGDPITAGALDLSTVTAVSAHFTGDGDSITAGGSAGTLALVLHQSGTAPRDVVTRVPNTASAQVSTSRGDATANASATFQINPATVEVKAGKTVNGAATARVVAGSTATFGLTATNSSNTALSALRIAEPAGSTASPLGDPADGRLTFLGFGADGSGTLAASTWPTGATSAVVTLLGTGSGLPATTTLDAPTGSTVTWPSVPAGSVVTGFTVDYQGVVAPGAVGTVPFRVSSDPAWSGPHAFANTVAVDGTAADGTPAAVRTASANLTVLPRQVVTTTTKSIAGTIPATGAGAVPVTGAVGQELVATLVGRISADTTVPVDRLVVEDVASGDAGSTLWDVAAMRRIGAVAIPSGSQAEVFVRQGGSWTPVAGPTTNATALLDLTLPSDADGLRIVYTPAGAATSLPIDGSFAPKTTLVLALTAEQTVGSSATNTATSTATDTGDGLSGTSAGTGSVTFGPGPVPVPIERVDASKSWRDPVALVPVDNADATATDRPTNRLTLRVQNITGVPVHALRLVDPDPSAPADAFDSVDVTHLTLTAPLGTTSLQVVLRDRSGAVLQTLTSAAQVAALSPAQLAEVAGIEARADGVLPDGAALVVTADTVLRGATRASGAPIVGTSAGAASTTLTNTLLGDLGAGTPSDPATAQTVLYPEALAPLAGASVKSLSPATGTRYAATARTVRLALSAHRTSDDAVSRPAQYVLEDTTAAFWDEFDLVGLQSLSGVTAVDPAGYTAAVQYLVDGTWSSPVTSTLAAGTSTTMPALPAGAGDLPAGVRGGAVTGIRITFTAPDGSWFANRNVGGFEGPTALVTLSPRSTLRSTGVEVPAGAVTNVVTGTVQGQAMSTPVDLTPAAAPYTVTDGVLDATVTKTPASTTTGPGSRQLFTLTATNTGTMPIDDPVLADVLPADAAGAQLVYDPASWGSATVALSPSGSTIAAVTPTVTLVGTQLRVTFPTGTRLMPGDRVTLTVPLVVRAGTPAGTTLVNTARLTGDGLTREANATIAVIALPTYLRTKDVAENLAVGQQPTGAVNTATGEPCTSADGYYRTPCLVRTQPGGTETWRLRLTNTGNLPTASATLVDVLPYPGDTGTSKSQSTSARGSVWAARYLGDLQVSGVPAGATATVSYLIGQSGCTFTGDPRSADPFGTGCPASAWTPAAQVGDLSQVRGVRVDLDLVAANLQPGQTVTVTFRTRSATAYDLAATDTDAPSWNTMVVTTASVTSSGLLHETLEPNRAGVAIDRSYALGDRVWLDTDRDGVQDDGEPGIAGVGVQLYAAGSSTLLASTTTDGSGHYLFDRLPAGDYRVRFVLDAATAARYSFTSTGRGGADLDSDADAGTGWTSTVTLRAGAGHVRPTAAGDGATADYLDPTIDAGLVATVDQGWTATVSSATHGRLASTGAAGAVGLLTTAGALLLGGAAALLAARRRRDGTAAES